jgi:hypothetical protein
VATTSPSPIPLPTVDGDPDPERGLFPAQPVKTPRARGTVTANRFGERTDLCALLRLRSLVWIEIDFCHPFDLVTDNGCIDLNRRGLHDVAPE